jgi:surfeit locus 1 family protein
VIGNVIEIEGILKLHPHELGVFDVLNNSEANQWYTWDVKRMSANWADVSVSPMVLHLLPGSKGTENLQVGPPKANLRNNHLGYAITWFSLALVLLTIAGLFIRKQVR